MSGLIVEVTLRRRNGSVVVRLEGDAFDPLWWSSHPANGPIFSEGRLLAGFKFTPREKTREPVFWKE